MVSKNVFGQMETIWQDKKEKEHYSMANYSKMASEIIACVGGKRKNIRGFVFTALLDWDFLWSMNLRQIRKRSKKIDGVWGCASKIGQLQIIIGQTVPDVYAEVCNQTGITAKAAVADDEKYPRKIRKKSHHNILTKFHGLLWQHALIRWSLHWPAQVC